MHKPSIRTYILIILYFIALHSDQSISIALMHRTISTLWLRVRTWTIEVSIAVVNMVNMLPVSCQPLALQSHASARGATTTRPGSTRCLFGMFSDQSTKVHTNSRDVSSYEYTRGGWASAEQGSGPSS